MLAPVLLLAQKNSKKNNQINVTTYVNYNPKVVAILWQEDRTIDINSIDLYFLTNTSGLFELESDTIIISVTSEMPLPSNKVNIGFGYQILNEKNVYQEFQIPIIHASESSQFIINEWRDNLTDVLLGKVENKQKINFFQLGLKYEIGKYLGKAEKGNFKLGFGVHIGTLYTYYRNDMDRLSREISTTPVRIEGNTLDLNLGANCNLWLKASDKLSFELKFSPHFNFISNKITTNNPSIQEQKRRANNDYGGNYYLSCGAKFKIQDFDKRRRSKR